MQQFFLAGAGHAAASPAKRAQIPAFTKSDETFLVYFT